MFALDKMQRFLVDGFQSSAHAAGRISHTRVAVETEEEAATASVASVCLNRCWPGPRPRRH